MVPGGVFVQSRRARRVLVVMQWNRSPPSQPTLHHHTLSFIMSAFETLPIELRIEILSNVADLRSLSSAIFASRFYHAAFDVSRERILYAVLERELSPPILRDSIAAITWPDEDTASHPPIEELCKIHGYVRAITSEFCSSCLRNPLRGGQELDPVPPSPGEIFRVQRAIYRYSLCTRLFRSVGSEQDQGCAKDVGRYLCMRGYTTWELEELKVVISFLSRRIREVCTKCIPLTQGPPSGFWVRLHRNRCKHRRPLPPFGSWSSSTSSLQPLAATDMGRSDPNPSMDTNDLAARAPTAARCPLRR